MSSKDKCNGDKNRQRSLASFPGFSVKVKSSGGNLISVAVPDIVDVDGKYDCSHCSKKFLSAQGLAVHVKCLHGDKDNKDTNMNEQKSDKVSVTASTSCDKFINVSLAPVSNGNGDLQPNENGAIVGKDVIVEPVESHVVVDNMDLNPSENSTPELYEENIDDPPAEAVSVVMEKKVDLRRGALKRRIYSANVKAEAISDVEAGSSMQDVALKFNVNLSLISKWVKNRSVICARAKVDKKNLFKIRPTVIKHGELYKRLYVKFTSARKRGWCVNFNWMWAHARKLYKEINNDDSLNIGKYVVVKFLKIYGIRMRRKQRNKKLSKEVYRQAVMKWHALTREKLIRTGFNENYDPKWGRFKPYQRFNVDQSPLPFVIEKKSTYEELPDKNESRQHKVWISQPGAGLEKRQCSLQIVFRPEGQQPRIAIVFRGKGFITEDERQAYHKDVDVYFQTNAWVDTAISVEWVNRTLAKCTGGSERFVLYCDNLPGQCADDFKEAVAAIGGVVWFVPPNTTDITQPVDAGYAQMLKVKVNQAQQKWLEDEDNADRWFNMDQRFSAKERRILIAHWVGEAYQDLCKNDNLRWRTFEKTGCLMTADGSGDELITPEGLDNYQVPPPMSLLDPQEAAPSTPYMEGVETPEIEEDLEPTTSEFAMAESDYKLDDEGDRMYEWGSVGKKFKILYDGGWYVGKVMYYNQTLSEYKVDFEDGSVDYVSPEDIDGVEVIEIG